MSETRLPLVAGPAASARASSGNGKPNTDRQSGAQKQNSAVEPPRPATVSTEPLYFHTLAKLNPGRKARRVPRE